MVVQELFATLGLKLDKNSFRSADRALGGLKTVAAGVIAAFGVSKLVGMVKGVADVADAASKASQKLVITTEAVQELGFAAKLSDIEQGELEGGLARLAKGLDDVATTGKGPTADALARLGVSFDDLKGKSLDQNLGVLSDAFARLPDGVAKTALASDVFGRQLGSKFIPLLNGGSAGLEAMREEARRLGIVVSSETGKKFEEFNDNQTRLAATWDGLKVQVVTGLLPTLNSLVDRVRAFIETNRELIAVGVERAIGLIISAFEVLGVVVSATVSVFEFFQENMDITEAILITLGGVLAAFAVSAAAAWVAAFAPVIAIGLAIGALVLFVRKLVRFFQTGEVDKIGVVLAIVFGPITVAVAAVVGLIRVVKELWALFSGEGVTAARLALAVIFWPITAAVAGIKLIKKGIEELGDLPGNIFGGIGDVLDKVKGKSAIDAIRTSGPRARITPAAVTSGPVNVGPSTFNVSLPSGDPVENSKAMGKLFDERWESIVAQTASSQ